MDTRIGLIAGSGQFPLLFTEAARKKGLEVFAAAYRNEAAPELESRVTAIQWLHLGQVRRLIKFFQAHGIQDAVIIGARFALAEAPTEQVCSAVDSFLEKKSRQPRGYSSGSMFKNPPGSPAGLLIEQAGMKGFAVGGAKVSEVHANFIINDGTATTSDIKTLLGIIKQRVQEKFDIELIEEVRIIG